MNKILFSLLCFLVLGCTSQKQEPATEAAPQDEGMMVSFTDVQLKTAGIQTGKPELRSMNSILQVNGLVDVPPQNLVTISFPFGGYLKTTRLLPGMHIRKGQVIAVLEDQGFVQLQQDYLIAKTKLAYLQKEYERQKFLNASKTTSDKLFEQTASQYQSEKILVRALREKLLLLGINPAALNENNISRTVNIYAPINGYVSSVKVNVGKYISPTDVLFELVNTERPHLALTVFEKDLPRLRPGQKVTAFLTNDPTKQYQAEVFLVSKTLDANRSATVHCHFTGATGQLLPGMFVTAEVHLNQTPSTAVPEEAVVRSGEQEYIFIERGKHRFEMTPVQTGVTENGYTAIVSPNPQLLQQTIITKNAYAALMKKQNKAEE